MGDLCVEVDQRVVQIGLVYHRSVDDCKDRGGKYVNPAATHGYVK